MNSIINPIELAKAEKKKLPVHAWDGMSRELKWAAVKRVAGLKNSELTHDQTEYLEAWVDMSKEQLVELAKCGVYGPDLGKQGGPVNHEHDDHDPFATIAAPQPDRYFDEPVENEPEGEPIDSKRNPVLAVTRILYCVAGKNHASLRMMAECLIAVVYGMESHACGGISRKWGTSVGFIEDLMRGMRMGDVLGWLDPIFFGLAVVPKKVRTIIPQKPTFKSADVVLHVLYAMARANHPVTRRRAECLLAIMNRTEAKSQADIARQHSLTRAAISKEMRDMRRLFLKSLKIYNFGGRPDVSKKSEIRAIRVHKEKREKILSWKPSPKLKTLQASL